MNGLQGGPQTADTPTGTIDAKLVLHDAGRPAVQLATICIREDFNRRGLKGHVRLLNSPSQLLDKVLYWLGSKHLDAELSVQVRCTHALHGAMLWYLQEWLPLYVEMRLRDLEGSVYRHYAGSVEVVL